MGKVQKPIRLLVLMVAPLLLLSGAEAGEIAPTAKTQLDRTFSARTPVDFSPAYADGSRALTVVISRTREGVATDQWMLVMTPDAQTSQQGSANWSVHSLSSSKFGPEAMSEANDAPWEMKRWLDQPDTVPGLIGLTGLALLAWSAARRRSGG